MKVLLDEGVPHPLVPALPKHEVDTVIGQGWASVKNGRLLALVEKNRYEVFVTGDRNMQHQQELANRPFAVLILSTINWPIMRQHLPAIAEAVDQALLGTVVPVDCGTFKPRPKWSAGEYRP